MSDSENKPTVPAPNLEQASDNEPLAKKEMPRFDSPVNIRVISYRKRNHDPDGVSVKAVLDGIVRAGILADDSTKQVKKITFESIICEKNENEKTVIEITDNT